MTKGIDGYDPTLPPTPDTAQLDADLEQKGVKPTVSIIYRDNELFSTLVPKIVAELESIGRKVTVHSFPQGTPQEEIENYFGNESTQNALEGTELFADDTSLNYGGRNVRGVVEKHKLDYFSKNVMGVSLVGSELLKSRNGGKENLAVVEGIKSVVSRLIEKRGTPEIFYIVKEQLTDHDFGSRLFVDYDNIVGQLFGIRIDLYSKENNGVKDAVENILSLDSARFTEMLREKLPYFKKMVDFGFDETELSEMVRAVLLAAPKDRGDLMHVFQEKWYSFVAEKLADSLGEIVGRDKIKIVEKVKEVVGGSGDGYALVDRHAGKSSEYIFSLPPEIKELLLPLPSMIDRIKKKGLLDDSVNADADNKTISAAVADVFGKKE